jgi:hypothetical protein
VIQLAVVAQGLEPKGVEVPQAFLQQLFLQAVAPPAAVLVPMAAVMAEVWAWARRAAARLAAQQATELDGAGGGSRGAVGLIGGGGVFLFSAVPDAFFASVVLAFLASAALASFSEGVPNLRTLLLDLMARCIKLAFTPAVLPPRSCMLLSLAASA